MVPDLFVVGATKCATSTLWHQLSQSEHISASEPKEPRLLEDGLSLNTVRDRYSEFFLHWKVSRRFQSEPFGHRICAGKDQAA